MLLFLAISSELKLGSQRRSSIQAFTDRRRAFIPDPAFAAAHFCATPDADAGQVVRFRHDGAAGFDHVEIKRFDFGRAELRNGGGQAVKLVRQKLLDCMAIFTGFGPACSVRSHVYPASALQHRGCEVGRFAAAGVKFGKFGVSWPGEAAQYDSRLSIKFTKSRSDGLRRKSNVKLASLCLRLRQSRLYAAPQV